MGLYYLSLILEVLLRQGRKYIQTHAGGDLINIKYSFSSSVMHHLSASRKKRTTAAEKGKGLIPELHSFSPSCRYAYSRKDQKEVRHK